MATLHHKNVGAGCGRLFDGRYVRLQPSPAATLLPQHLEVEMGGDGYTDFISDLMVFNLGSSTVSFEMDVDRTSLPRSPHPDAIDEDAQLLFLQWTSVELFITT